MTQLLERAKILLEKARGDAYVVARGSADPQMPDWIMGFHAQQAVEKALKAILTAKGIEFPRTHNLRVLARELRNGGFDLPPDVDRLGELTPFGAVMRYDSVPDSEPDIKMDRQTVLASVERTLAWAARHLASDK